jgi:hypothetical protein
VEYVEENASEGAYMNTYLKKLNLPKVEASKPLVIEILPSDIKISTRKNPAKCAFSTACRRSSKGVIAAYFFRTTAWLQYKSRLVRYVLPQSVQKEIVSFDRNKTMDPGIYQLSPASPANRLAAVRKRAQPGRKSSKNAVRTKVVRHYTTSIRGAA